ncbi:MAG TPA: adenylate/guanylate cyclase domain-containing protein [Alphaproteobacteria bacterium]|nr:adenylate/guanylate cyclase domain-containing protein [Alphaproteobacteria bacterium]
MAAVVGRRKFFYDAWGDVVNLASRIGSTNQAGKNSSCPKNPGADRRPLRI